MAILPLQTVSENHQDRRSFLGQTARLAALAVLASACSNIDSITGPGLDADVLVKLADYPELAQPVSAVRVRDVNTPLALVNLGGGAYAALSLICPHQGTTVQWTGGAFLCPNHGARFAADGEWTGGQPTGNLREYITTYDAQAGTVLISAP